jgi:hypothetical protein
MRTKRFLNVSAPVPTADDPVASYNLNFGIPAPQKTTGLEQFPTLAYNVAVVSPVAVTKPVGYVNTPVLPAPVNTPVLQAAIDGNAPVATPLPYQVSSPVNVEVSPAAQIKPVTNDIYLGTYSPTTAPIVTPGASEAGIGGSLKEIATSLGILPAATEGDAIKKDYTMIYIAAGVAGIGILALIFKN